MAITFIQQKKRQRYLVFVLATAILIGLIFFLQQAFKKPAQEEVSPSADIAKMTKKVEVNLDIFRNPAFNSLKTFEELPFPEDKIGRINPFLPY